MSKRSDSVDGGSAVKGLGHIVGYWGGQLDLSVRVAMRATVEQI